MRHELRSRQHTAHGLPLDTDSAAVDNSQSEQAQLVRLFQIRFGHPFHVSRGNRVQVEDVRDLNSNYAVWVLYLTTIPSI